MFGKDVILSCYIASRVFFYLIEKINLNFLGDKQVNEVYKKNKHFT